MAWRRRRKAKPGAARRKRAEAAARDSPSTRRAFPGGKCAAGRIFAPHVRAFVSFAKLKRVAQEDRLRYNAFG